MSTEEPIDPRRAPPREHARDAADAGEELLLDDAEGSVVRRADGALEFRCEGLDLRLYIGIVASFAVIVSTIVVSLVLARLIPWPMISIVVVWLVLGLVARWQLAKLAKARGVFVVDPSLGVLIQRHRRREVGRWPLADVRWSTMRDPWFDGAEREGERGATTVAPRWLLADVGHGPPRKLARAKPWALRRTLAALEELGLRCSG